MVEFMRFSGQIASDEEADQMRESMREGMASSMEHSQRVERAEAVSMWFTAIIASFIVLASFLTIGILFQPWLDLWAFIFSAAYIIVFFGLQAESKKAEPAFT